MFLFYVLCVVREKILATIFLSHVPTNIICYETVKLVYRMTHTWMFGEYFIAALVHKGFNQVGLLTQFYAVYVTQSEIWTWVPTLSFSIQFKSYFFNSRCKKFHKNTTADCLNDFMQLNIFWCSLVNVSFGPVLIDIIWSKVRVPLGHCWPISYSLCVYEINVKPVLQTNTEVLWNHELYKEDYVHVWAMHNSGKQNFET